MRRMKGFKRRVSTYGGVCIAYHVAIWTDVVLVDPEYGATPLCAHAGVCQPACPRIFLIFGFDLIFTHLGMFPKASPTLSQVEPGSGVKNHLQRAMKCEQDICQNNLGRPVMVL